MSLKLIGNILDKFWKQTISGKIITIFFLIILAIMMWNLKNYLSTNSTGTNLYLNNTGALATGDNSSITQNNYYNNLQASIDVHQPIILNTVTKNGYVHKYKLWICNFTYNSYININTTKSNIKITAATYDQEHVSIGPHPNCGVMDTIFIISFTTSVPINDKDIFFTISQNKTN